MGGVAEGQPNRTSRIARAVACVFACAASAAGQEAPRPAPAPARPSGGAAKLEEGKSPRILYFEESGGLISPIARPKSGSGREPVPPLPEKGAVAPAKPAPVARVPAAKTPAASPVVPAGASPKTPPAAPDVAGEWQRKVDRAIDESEQEALVALADAPGASYDCASAYRGWAVAEALAAAGRQSGAARILDPLAAGCDESTRLSTLEQARRAIPREEYLRWEAREAKAARSADGDRRLRRIVHERVLDERTMATGTPLERARRLEKAVGETTIEFRDTGSAVYMGWLFLEGGEVADAERWFGRGLAWTPGSEDAIAGLANTAIRTGDPERAIAYANQLPQASPDRARFRRDALVALALRDYEAKRYREAAARLDAAAREGTLPVYARAMRAWCSFNLGESEDATARFAALYREARDRESAQGLAAAAGHDAARIPADLVVTEPLRMMLAERQGEQAFRGGRYLEARALDPKAWGEAGSPGTWNALLGEGYRRKSGQPGLGKLRQSPWHALDATMPVGAVTSLVVRAEKSTLDAGTLEANAFVGSAPPAAGPTPALATKVDAKEYAVAIRHERGAAMTFSLGRGPDGGPVDPRVTGSVEWAAAPAWGQLTAMAFAEPVRETVLSYAGMRDPWTGAAWGGVMRTGAELRLLRLREAPWTTGLRLRGEILDGTQVQDNSRAVADATVGRDLGLAGFAYAALSAYAGLEGYRRNLGGFTLGHGGYFSPQRYGRVGAALDFMTEENRTWLVRGRASAGWFRKRDDASPVLPLDPDGRFYAGGTTSGHEAGVRVAGVYQASPRVQVGALAGRSLSPAYAENLARVELRILFEPRRSVVAADLPTGRGF